MTDARFLSNNSVTCEENHLKCNTLMQDSCAYKSPKQCRNRSKSSPLRGDSTKKWKFLPFWGPRSHPREPFGVKFCVAKLTHVPLDLPKFHVNPIGATSRPSGAKMLIFGLSKFNIGSLPLRGILPVMRCSFAM